MSGDVQSPVEQALDAAGSGEIIEVALEQRTHTTVTVAGQRIESSESSTERGLGIRLFRGGQVGFAATVRLDSASVREAVERARDLARCSRAEEENRPAPPGGTAAALLPAPDPVPPAGLVAPTTRLESAALNQGPGLRTRAASITATGGTWLVAHSAGLWRQWAWSRAWGALEVVAEQDGLRQTGWESDWAENTEQLDPEAIGSTAARRALRKFGASRPATARLPVVLAPTVTAGLFEGLAEALSGKAVARGRSLFAGRQGESLASPQVTLTDDGARRDGFHAAPYDGEGQPCRTGLLIDNGVLRGYLHNTYTSLKLGAAACGHAVRDSFASVPHVGIRNLCLQPSGISRDAILSSVAAGVHVDEVMGLHTIDPVSGDFSLGATGREVRQGQLGAPLEGFTIAGNVRDILHAVQAVGDDLRFLPEGGGGSTVLLEGLTVSGR